MEKKEKLFFDVSIFSRISYIIGASSRVSLLLSFHTGHEKEDLSNALNLMDDAVSPVGKLSTWWLSKYVWTILVTQFIKTCTNFRHAKF